MPEVVVVGSFKAEPGKQAEALDAHLASPHVAAVLERAPELFGENGEIVVYEAVAGEQTVKGSLAAHAASA
jgi:hypothetical protein